MFFRAVNKKFINTNYNIMKFIHRIKKIRLSQIIFWVIINAVLLPFRVFADPPYSGEGKGISSILTNPLNSSSFAELIESIAKLAAKIGIPIAALFIIYSGLLFVTARGNEKQLETAKASFTWAIIGTAILLGAWVIASAIEATIRSF